MFSEADTRDKRAMIEEMLELQRRLDDLTPTLAEKENRISRVENERDALVSKLRSANNEVATFKVGSLFNHTIFLVSAPNVRE